MSPPVAPTLKDTPGDADLLADKLDAFERWHAARATLQILPFLVLLWALVSM